MQDARMLLRPSLLPRKPCKMCLTVWFLRRFGLKTGIDFAHFGLESSMVFEVGMNVFSVSIPKE